MLSIYDPLMLLRLTALLLIFRGLITSMSVLSNALIAIPCMLMLLNRRLLTERTLWLAVFTVTVSMLVSRWDIAENNTWLVAYWILACVFFTAQPDKGSHFRLNGRLLIGLVFSIAVCQKLAAGEYLNGDFFHAALLMDSRFALFAKSIGGVSAADYALNDKLVAAMVSVPGPFLTGIVTSTDAIRNLALALSYWTLAVETSVGLCFLFGKEKRGQVKTPKFTCPLFSRNTPLIIFLLTTYTFAPVPRFGSILCILALAQLEGKQRGLRAVYLTLFFFQQMTLFLT